MLFTALEFATGWLVRIAMDQSSIFATFAALLSEGLKSLKPSIRRHLDREDFSAALKEANQDYAAQGARSLDTAMVYAILLTFRELGEEALGVLRKVVEFHTHEPAIQLLQIDALFARGDDESAEALMDGMKQVTFQDVRHLSYLGDLYASLGRDDDALTVYHRAIEQGSEDPQVASSVALLLIARDDSEGAARMYEMAGQLDPEDPEHWFMAAEAWMDAGEFGYAAKAYRRVLRFDDENARLWLYLGVALSETGELEDALEAFTRAKKLEPDEAEHWLNCGLTLLELGQPEEARRQYEQAARLSPDDPEAFNGMAAAAFELGDVELAESLSHKGLELEPDNPHAHHNLGIIQLAMNHLKDAEASFLRALENTQNDPNVKTSLALVYVRSNRIAEALQMIEEAATLPEFEANAIFQFSRDLLRYGGADHLLSFIPTVENRDPQWLVMKSIFEFLAHALRREVERVEEFVEEFITSVKAHTEVIPFEWDFEELERLGLGLEASHRSILDLMIAVLEGRKDVSKLEIQAA